MRKSKRQPEDGLSLSNVPASTGPRLAPSLTSGRLPVVLSSGVELVRRVLGNVDVVVDKLSSAGVHRRRVRESELGRVKADLVCDWLLGESIQLLGVDL